MAVEIHGQTQQTAVVTGAGGRIGRTVTEKLATEGWKVAGIDLISTDTDYSLRVDVTDRATLSEAVDQIIDHLGAIKLLVTAAGDYGRSPFGDMELSRWQRMLDVWLGGTTNACATVVPRMLASGGGTVVLLAADSRSQEDNNVYVAAASGTLLAFAKSFGCEVAASGVRVNCLALQPHVDPGWVAETVHFLASEGQYYAAQVMYTGSSLQKKGKKDNGSQSKATR